MSLFKIKLKDIKIDINETKLYLNKLEKEKQQIEQNLINLENQFINMNKDEYIIECIKYLYKNIDHLEQIDKLACRININNTLEDNIDKIKSSDIIKFAHIAHCNKLSIEFKEEYIFFNNKIFSIYFE